MHCTVLMENQRSLFQERQTLTLLKEEAVNESVAHTCKNCHVRVYNKPAPEVMDGIVSIPMGCFDKPDKLEPKVEMWTMEKLSFLNKSDSIVESFEGNAITERLMALLKSMEER